MSKRLPLLLAALLGAAATAPSEELTCIHALGLGHHHLHHANLFTPGGLVARRYAPDRKADFLHARIEVTPDFKERSVTGTTSIRFKPIGLPLEELRLDAVDLRVFSVTSTVRLKGYQVTDHEIVVSFAEPVPVGREVTVAIDHKAFPQDGLYFRTPELGYKPEDTHLFSQGETHSARHWYPMHDAPNEMLTTEIICHVPADMRAFANGRLVGTETNSATGLVGYHWKQEKPHVNYLVCLVAGYFKSIDDTQGEVPLSFLVSPGDLPMARNSYRLTKEMMVFYEREIGMPFPWEKYYQIVVRDFIAGGMENTSLSVLSDRTLFSDDYGTTRSSEGLVAHELIHQWFGDVVTCKDWSHLWLNEGFATYYDKLFVEHHHGREQFLHDMFQTARSLTAQTNNTRPIVTRVHRENAGDQFSGLTYGKGSWVLHMIRNELGNDLYRQAIQTYLDRHKFQPVVTADLLRVLEEMSGRSFDRFFDQWLYHGGNPALAVEYAWDQKTGLARVAVRQTQPVNDDVLLFHVPLRLRFKGDFGSVDHVVQITRETQEFEFSFQSAPKIVRVDPDMALLARIDFNPPRAMVEAQLADTSDALGRILAMERLGRDRAADSLTKIRDVLRTDRRWFVRAGAASALGRIGTAEALTALATSLEQPEPRARRAVVEAIGGFTLPAAFGSLTNVLASEKNPDIRDTAVRALARHPGEATTRLLLAHLDSVSLREHLFDAAVAAMRTLDDPAFVTPLREAILRRESDLVGRTWTSALSALGFLARHDEDKSAVRALLLGKTAHLRETAALGAMEGLGNLDDPSARATLSALALNAPSESRQRAAERALRSLDQTARPPAAIPDLRADVLELQKNNRDLQKQVETLRQRLEAIGTRPPSGRR